MSVFDATVNYLRQQVIEKRYLEVTGGFEESDGFEKQLGVSKSILRRALHELNTEGYLTYYLRLTQHGSGKTVTIRVFTLPDVTFKEVLDHISGMQPVESI